MIKEILEYAGEYRLGNIKNITGREGYGWSANIFKNGVLIGDAVDYADGGPARVNILKKEDKIALDEYALSVNKSEFNFEITEMFLENLVNYESSLKKIKRAAKTNIIFKRGNDKLEADENNIPLSYATIKYEYNEDNKKLILNKYPDAYFINDDVPSIDFNIVKTKSLKIKN